MEIIENIWRRCLVVCMLGMAAHSLAVASAETPSAYAVMSSTTDRIMNILAEAEAYYDDEPERFYEQVHAVLDEVVDFEGFARGVMGRYASKKRYLAMNAEQRANFREQVTRFAAVMRIGLVRTYGKGLIAFNGSRVEIQPPAEGADPDSRSVTVVQHIYGEGDDPYVIHYSMRLSGDNEWVLRNMIVESINLGQIYRNQFESAMRDHKGDINLVIDNWAIDTVEQDNDTEPGEAAESAS